MRGQTYNFLNAVRVCFRDVKDKRLHSLLFQFMSHRLQATKKIASIDWVDRVQGRQRSRKTRSWKVRLHEADPRSGEKLKTDPIVVRSSAPEQLAEHPFIGPVGYTVRQPAFFSCGRPID